jgi:hypothetical protein
MDGQIHSQDAVLAAKIFRLWNFAPLRRTWTRIGFGFLGSQRLVGGEYQKAKAKKKARFDCQPQENRTAIAVIQKNSFQDAPTTRALRKTATFPFDLKR